MWVLCLFGLGFFRERGNFLFVFSSFSRFSGDVFVVVVSLEDRPLVRKESKKS